MDTLSLYELFLIERKKGLGTDCGVIDQGIYYLVAIVLKNQLKGSYIVINGTKREFLQNMLDNVQNETLLKFILEKIMENATTTVKWKGWTKQFMRLYRKAYDIIIEDEVSYADEIIVLYPQLLDVIHGVDNEGEYVDYQSLYETFRIEEMIPAIRSFCSQDFTTFPDSSVEVPEQEEALLS